MGAALTGCLASARYLYAARLNRRQGFDHCMRRIILLFVDLMLVALSAVAAGLVRDNLEFIPGHFLAALPYDALSVAVAAPILLFFGLNRSVWRFSGLRDYVNIMSAAVLITSAALSASFLINRQEGVARALPLLHVMIMIASMVGLRVLSRVWHSRRRAARPLDQVLQGQQRDGVLIVGLTALAELYIRATSELGERAPRIEGLLGRATHHTGRLIQQYRVLGTPEDIGAILAQLEVHGVRIDRIVIASRVDQLSTGARAALLDIGRQTAIKVDFLPEIFVGWRAGSHGGLEALAPVAPIRAAEDGLAGDAVPSRQVDTHEVDQFARRPYWHLKRAFDAVFALVLIVLLLPLMVLTAVLVALDVGLPVVFWQQRPGLGGRPFRLYKFRTMSAKYDAMGRCVLDEKRTSGYGWFLRRTRLDELPQLFNILMGDMSFVGPRPLLAADQSEQFAARLLVRPGLTGWAQVKGGRSVGADDKAALDIWYICKASLWLDLAIIASTVPMVVFGERSNGRAIGQARFDLLKLGVWRASGSLVPGE